jgi:hypothetical protein
MVGSGIKEGFTEHDMTTFSEITDDLEAPSRAIIAEWVRECSDQERWTRRLHGSRLLKEVRWFLENHPELAMSLFNAASAEDEKQAFVDGRNGFIRYHAEQVFTPLPPGEHNFLTVSDLLGQRGP